jgi:hypothetical protein
LFRPLVRGRGRRKRGGLTGRLDYLLPGVRQTQNPCSFEVRIGFDKTIAK